MAASISKAGSKSKRRPQTGRQKKAQELTDWPRRRPGRERNSAPGGGIIPFFACMVPSSLPETGGVGQLARLDTRRQLGNLMGGIHNIRNGKMQHNFTTEHSPTSRLASLFTRLPPLKNLLEKNRSVPGSPTLVQRHTATNVSRHIQVLAMMNRRLALFKPSP